MSNFKDKLKELQKQQKKEHHKQRKEAVAKAPPARRGRPVAEDLNIIHTPDSWTHWPFMPMTKRRTDEREKELGILVADGDMRGQVRLLVNVNMFGLPKDADEKWYKDHIVKYESAEEMLKDGWMVD